MARLEKSFHGLDARQARLAYDMSFSLTKKLRDRRGRYALAQFLKESAGRPGAVDAEFRKFFHQDYADFLAAWRGEHQ